MDQHGRRIEWLVWAGLGLLIATLLLGFLLAKLKQQRLGAKTLPVYGQVADFRLTNQVGASVKLADVKGRVWVADIIFTRCPGPCGTMTGHMKTLEQALPADSAARLISITTDPQYDTPEVLAAYAAHAGADTNRWWFLTGSKSDITKLAVDSLKLTTIEKKPEERESVEDLFLHSTLFVVIDKQGRLRGIYETLGEGVDFEKVKLDILSAVRQLEQE